MSKLIIKIMVLLAIFSLCGVVGATAIVGVHQGGAGIAAAIGWVAGCSVLYLVCVDRLVIHG